MNKTWGGVIGLVSTKFTNDSFPISRAVSHSGQYFAASGAYVLRPRQCLPHCLTGSLPGLTAFMYLLRYTIRIRSQPRQDV